MQGRWGIAGLQQTCQPLAPNGDKVRIRVVSQRALSFINVYMPTPRENSQVGEH